MEETTKTASELLSQIKKACFKGVNLAKASVLKGDRDTLTYQLACDLRHICGRNFEWWLD